jgi:hypothetical protein
MNIKVSTGTSKKDITYLNYEEFVKKPGVYKLRGFENDLIRLVVLRDHNVIYVNDNEVSLVPKNNFWNGNQFLKAGESLTITFSD